MCSSTHRRHKAICFGLSLVISVTCSLSSAQERVRPRSEGKPSIGRRGSSGHGGRQPHDCDYLYNDKDGSHRGSYHHGYHGDHGSRRHGLHGRGRGGEYDRRYGDDRYNGHPRHPYDNKRPPHHDKKHGDPPERPGRPKGNFWGGVGIGPVFLDSGFVAPPPTQFSSRGTYAIVNMPQGEAYPANFVAGNTQVSVFTERAEVAFRAKNYGDALRWLMHAQIEQPENGWLTLFGAEALFAIGDYGAAADALSRGISQLQPAPWNAIALNQKAWYENGDYITQMGRLEAFMSRHGGDEATLLLRGYHAAFHGDSAAAISDLQQVLMLSPDHSGVSSLLKFLGASQLATEIITPEIEIELLPAIEE